MIQKAALTGNQWYDGFTWYAGRQNGVATRMWVASEQAFVELQKDGRLANPYLHLEDFPDKRVWKFEPNVEGVRPNDR